MKMNYKQFKPIINNNGNITQLPKPMPITHKCKKLKNSKVTL